MSATSSGAAERVRRSLAAWLDAYEDLQRAQAPLRAAVIEAPELREIVGGILGSIDQATPSWKVVHDELRELLQQLADANARAVLDQLAARFEATMGGVPVEILDPSERASLAELAKP